MAKRRTNKVRTSATWSNKHRLSFNFFYHILIALYTVINNFNINTIIAIGNAANINNKAIKCVRIFSSISIINLKNK